MAETTAPRFVRLAADGVTEVRRYPQRGTANRACKTAADGSFIVTVEELAERAAESAAAEAEAAAEVAQQVADDAAADAARADEDADAIRWAEAAARADADVDPFTVETPAAPQAPRERRTPTAEGEYARPAGTASNGAAVDLWEARRTVVRAVRLDGVKVGEIRQDGGQWTGYSLDGVKMTDPFRARRAAAVALADATLSDEG